MTIAPARMQVIETETNIVRSMKLITCLLSSAATEPQQYCSLQCEKFELFYLEKKQNFAKTLLNHSKEFRRS